MKSVKAIYKTEPTINPKQNTDLWMQKIRTTSSNNLAEIEIIDVSRP